MAERKKGGHVLRENSTLPWQIGMLAIRWARIRRANVVATRRTYGPCSYCTQEGRSLALTETDTESDLDWQHPVDKEDIPLELMRLHDGTLSPSFSVFSICASGVPV